MILSLAKKPQIQLCFAEVRGANDKQIQSNTEIKWGNWAAHWSTEFLVTLGETTL